LAADSGCDFQLSYSQILKTPRPSTKSRLITITNIYAGRYPARIFGGAGFLLGFIPSGGGTALAGI